jgi:hypothetical protein
MQEGKKSSYINFRLDDELEEKKEQFLMNPPPLPSWNCIPKHSIDDEHDSKKNRMAIFTNESYKDNGSYP